MLYTAEYQTTAKLCPWQPESSAKFGFLFSQTVLTHIRYHFDSKDNLFWPSNKLFQKVFQIIHDDLMSSVMIFVFLFLLVPSWI